MPNYKLLQMENIPNVCSKVFKTKPQLATCISLALGMCALTASAVCIGILIGYTYCYLEHHSGFRPVRGNITYSKNQHLINVPFSEEAKYNRTINGALASSILVSRILRLGQALVREDIVELPWIGNEPRVVLHHS